MVLIHRCPFSVSRYHRENGAPIHAEAHGGLVLPVQVRCKTWLPGLSQPAEAFLDSGADATIFSLRWIAEHGPPLEHPAVDPCHRLADDAVTIEIAGRLLRVPLGPAGPLLRRQGEVPPGWEQSTLWEEAEEMPGYEDILLGRDFFRANDLLLLVDYGERCFSLLHPGDRDNLRRRERVLAAFDPSQPL